MTSVLEHCGRVEVWPQDGEGMSQLLGGEGRRGVGRVVIAVGFDVQPGRTTSVGALWLATTSACVKRAREGRSR